MGIYIDKRNFKRRALRACKAALCICVCAGVMVAGGSYFTKKIESNVAATGSWGLSFREEGKLPTGNATKDYLKKYNAVYVGDTTSKTIYLTFDAGYENGNTEKTLDVLKSHKAPAGFFLVGNYIQTNPEIVKRMAQEGHTVGNHTMHHPDMAAIGTKESFVSELQELEELYKKTTGEEMKKYYRPPQGKYSEENLKLAKELGYKTIFWSLAYVDWYESKQPTKQEAFDKLIPRVHPGAIVLLHSTSETNANILDELLTEWEEMGYKFKSITEL